MLPLLLTLFFAGRQAPIDQPPRLRTLLPNGAVVLVERVPHAKALVFDLFASSRGAEESPETQGRRHLLEHLASLGPDGNLDVRLESAGGFLSARTMRDSMEFDMSLPADGMKVGIATLKELLAPAAVDEAAIAREANSIDQESAVRTDASRASAAAWDVAFGDRGLDPFGNLDVIRGTRPDDLRTLQRRAFAANNVAVVIEGDVDLDVATRQVADVLTLLPIYSGAKDALPSVPQTGVSTADARGEYRAIIVPGFRSPQTAAALAAALALCRQIPGGDVVYTPSAHPGLVILTAPQGGLTDAVLHASAASLFTPGRLAAMRWIEAYLSEPESAASFRGQLMVSERDLRPETMRENLDALRYPDFKQAVDNFKGNCVIVGGRR